MEIHSGFSVLFLILLSFHFTTGTFLAGVTIESSPFIEVKNNEFKGFCVDLMDLIQERTGLNYSLYLVKDGLYGPGFTKAGVVNGLIGDVFKKKADFAIADLTVTERRARYVRFTTPFLKFSFSALVRRSLAKNLHTMDDLAIKSNLSIGTLAGGRTLVNMQQVTDTIRNVQWLYKQINRNISNLVLTMDEALHKVYTEPFAFIQEEPKNLYYARENCSLKVLRDQNMYLPGEYAIALPLDSPYIDTFNRAIENIRDSGHIKRLFRKHFVNPQCRSHGTSIVTRPGYYLYLYSVTVSISFWLFSFKASSVKIR